MNNEHSELYFYVRLSASLFSSDVCAYNSQPAPMIRIFYLKLLISRIEKILLNFSVLETMISDSLSCFKRFHLRVNKRE